MDKKPLLMNAMVFGILGGIALGVMPPQTKKTQTSKVFLNVNMGCGGIYSPSPMDDSF